MQILFILILFYLFVVLFDNADIQLNKILFLLFFKYFWHHFKPFACLLSHEYFHHPQSDSSTPFCFCSKTILECVNGIWDRILWGGCFSLKQHRRWSWTQNPFGRNVSGSGSTHKILSCCWGRWQACGERILLCRECRWVLGLLSQLYSLPFNFGGGRNWSHSPETTCLFAHWSPNLVSSCIHSLYKCSTFPSLFFYPSFSFSIYYYKLS